jgi:starch phosphorylase
MFPERFNNKTNGVTPRRWLHLSNPALSRAITEAIGDGWIKDLTQLRRLEPFARDAAFSDSFLGAKKRAKRQFADWLRSASGEVVDPDSIFDCATIPGSICIRGRLSSPAKRRPHINSRN